MLHFKTNQTLALAGLSEEKLRVWKAQLSPLRRFDGRKGGFSIEQVVALAVINRIATGLSVPIRSLAPYADELFDGVARHLRNGGTPALLVLTVREFDIGACHFVESLKEVEDEVALLMVQLGPVSERVRAMATNVTDGQERLFE